MKATITLLLLVCAGSCMAQRDVGAMFPQTDGSVFYLDGDYLLYLPQPSVPFDTLGRLAYLDPKGEHLNVRPDKTAGLGLIFLSFLDHLKVRIRAGSPCVFEDGFALMSNQSVVDAVCVKFNGENAHLAFIYQSSEIEQDAQDKSLLDVKVFIGNLQTFLKGKGVPSGEFISLFEDYKKVGEDSAQVHFRNHVEEKGRFWEDCYLTKNVREQYPNLFQEFRKNMEHATANLYSIGSTTTSISVEKLDLVKDDPYFIGKYLERLSSKSCTTSDLFVVDNTQTHIHHKFIFPEKSYLEYWWSSWKRFDPVGSFTKEDVEWCLEEVLDTIANRILPYGEPILEKNLTLSPIYDKKPLALQFRGDDCFQVWSPRENGTAKQLRLRNLEAHANETPFITAVLDHLQPSDGKTDLLALGAERFAHTAAGKLTCFFNGRMEEVGQVSRPAAVSLWEWFLQEVIQDRKNHGHVRKLESYELAALPGIPEFITYAYPQDTVLTLLIEPSSGQRKRIQLHDPDHLRRNVDFFASVLKSVRTDGSILQLFRTSHCLAALQEPQLWLDNPVIPVLDSIYCPGSRKVLLAIVDTLCVQVARGHALQSTFYAPQPTRSRVMGIQLEGRPHRLFAELAPRGEVRSAQFLNPAVARDHPELLTLLIQDARGDETPITLWQSEEIFFAWKGDQLWSWQPGLPGLKNQGLLGQIQDAEVMQAFLTKMAEVLRRNHVDEALNARFSYERDSLGMAVMGGNFKGEGDFFWACGRPGADLKIADNLLLKEFLDYPPWLITYLRDVFNYGKDQVSFRTFQDGPKRFAAIKVKSPVDTLRIFDFKMPRTYKHAFTSKYYGDLERMGGSLAVEFLGYLHASPSSDIWATSVHGFCVLSGRTVRIRLVSERNEPFGCTEEDSVVQENIRKFKESRGEKESVPALCKRLAQCIADHWDGSNELLHEVDCGFKYIPGTQRTIIDLFCN